LIFEHGKRTKQKKKHLVGEMIRRKERGIKKKGEKRDEQRKKKNMKVDVIQTIFLYIGECNVYILK